MLAVSFSTSIGLGSIITLVVIVSGVALGWFKWRQSDPSEWRENYLAEVTRREEVEKEAFMQRELKHEALIELAAVKGRTDLAPLMTAIANLQAAQQRSEERMTARLDAFEN